MEDLGATSEHEVVLAFLRAEIDSPRTGFRSMLHPDFHRLVDRPDLSNPVENAQRADMLRQLRGYGANKWLFAGFPSNVAWRRVRLAADEVRALRYTRYPCWVKLSGGTRVVADGAGNVDASWAPPDLAPSIKAVTAAVRAGQTYPELIVVKAHDGALILVEGHTRATAYVLAGTQAVDAFVGSSPRIREWVWYGY